MKAEKAFEMLTAELVEKLEDYCAVKCHPELYLEALKYARGEINSWFEVSIEAAKDDIDRLSEED
jgi:hypothetical protein